jgi:hypothetical protein
MRLRCASQKIFPSNTVSYLLDHSKSNIKYYIYKIPERIELTEKQITGIVNLLRLNKPNI